jgi:hypothetical protein
MEEFADAERRPGQGTKRDCLGGVAKRSRYLVQPGFTTVGEWIHEFEGSLTARRSSHYIKARPPDIGRTLAGIRSHPNKIKLNLHGSYICSHFSEIFEGFSTPRSAECSREKLNCMAIHRQISGQPAARSAASGCFYTPPLHKRSQFFGPVFRHN